MTVLASVTGSCVPGGVTVLTVTDTVALLPACRDERVASIVERALGAKGRRGERVRAEASRAWILSVIMPIAMGKSLSANALASLTIRSVAMSTKHFICPTTLSRHTCPLALAGPTGNGTMSVTLSRTITRLALLPPLTFAAIGMARTLSRSLVVGQGQAMSYGATTRTAQGPGTLTAPGLCVGLLSLIGWQWVSWAGVLTPGWAVGQQVNLLAPAVDVVGAVGES